MTTSTSQGRPPYVYFIDGIRYESEAPLIAGSVLRSKLPPEKSEYGIFEEAEGDLPDPEIGNDQQVSLINVVNPKKFYSVPSATYGAV